MGKYEIIKSNCMIILVQVKVEPKKELAYRKQLLNRINMNCIVLSDTTRLLI